MGIMEIRVNVHNRILALRSISNILLSEKYQLCHSRSDIATIQIYVDSADPTGLTKYLDQLIERHEIPKSMKELRVTAKQLGVPYYSAMNRSKLIEAIQNAERSKKTTSKMPLVEQRKDGLLQGSQT